MGDKHNQGKGKNGIGDTDGWRCESIGGWKPTKRRDEDISGARIWLAGGSLVWASEAPAGSAAFRGVEH